MFERQILDYLARVLPDGDNIVFQCGNIQSLAELDGFVKLQSVARVGDRRTYFLLNIDIEYLRFVGDQNIRNQVFDTVCMPKMPTHRHFILADSKTAEELGLTQGDLVLYAKCEDLPAQRQQGDSLNVDGRDYLIASWRVDYGMAKVYIFQNIG